MLDWRGNKIDVGCSIVYPCRQGSNIWIIEANVLEVLEKEIIVKPVRSAGHGPVAKKPVHIKNVDRVTVVTRASAPKTAGPSLSFNGEEASLLALLAQVAVSKDAKLNKKKHEKEILNSLSGEARKVGLEIMNTCSLYSENETKLVAKGFKNWAKSLRK